MKTLAQVGRAVVGSALLISGCSSEPAADAGGTATFVHSDLAREAPAANPQALDAAVQGNTELALSLYGKLKVLFMGRVVNPSSAPAAGSPT